MATVNHVVAQPLTNEVGFFPLELAKPQRFVLDSTTGDLEVDNRNHSVTISVTRWLPYNIGAETRFFVP